MFEIVGEKQHFTQYELNQLVVNPCMKVNDKVVFRNSCGKTSVTYAREQDGKVVADVPNILLQYPLNILVNLRQDNELHIDCETVFSVMEAEKPEDYKFVDNIIPKPAQTVVASVQSDWNASEGEPGYIKNRTHWEVRTPIVENVSFTALKKYDIIANNVIPGTTYHIVLTVGESVTEYECVAYQVDYGWKIATWIGNGRLRGEDGGEDVPFVFTADDGEFLTTIDGSFSVDRSNNGAFPFDDYHYFEGNEYAYVLNDNITVTVSTPIVVGNTYCVTMNGIDYYCLATDGGNTVELKSENNSFNVYYWEEDPPVVEIYEYDKAGEIVFSIYEADVHKLDSKYLPATTAKTDLILIGPTSFDDDVVGNTEFVGSLNKLLTKKENGEIPSVYFRDYDNLCFCPAISMKFEGRFAYFKFNHYEQGVFTYVMSKYGDDEYVYDFFTE